MERDDRREVDWADKVKAEIEGILGKLHLFDEEKAEEIMHIVIRERAGMLDQCKFEYLEGGQHVETDSEPD